MSVQTPQRPRMWRFYSPANAPRPDGSLEFHVRAVDGGWVSSALVLSASVGDVLQVGPPVGRLTLADGSSHLLMIAGGTGLAPLWAIVEQVLARSEAPERRITLFHEAHTERHLYDLARLDRVAAADSRLSVVPVARSGPVARAEPGRAVDAALRRRRWADHDVYVCGSSEMVAHAVGVLTQSGLDAARLRRETFGYRTVPSPTSHPSSSAVPGSDQP
jgi:ferredoxin-NADP reductase